MDNDGRTPGDGDAGAPKKKGSTRAKKTATPRRGSAAAAPPPVPTPPAAAGDVAPAGIETFIGEPAPVPGAEQSAAPTTAVPAGAPVGSVQNVRAPVPGADVPSRPPVARGGGPTPPAPPTASAAPAVVARGETRKVGLLVGREWSFPPEFIEAVNGRDEGVTAEFVKLGAEHMDDPRGYAVIIDRISHEVPFYRTWLKHAVLQGTTVVNNPFMWSADDKFFGASLITKLGLASPKTAVLPNKSYIPGIVPSESLRNLKYPLDWKALVEWVGLPCILKDAHGGGWKEVYVCRSLEELLHHYDNSGLLTMVVQEFIQWEQFVRCLCVGQDEILPMKYDPKERRYLVEHEHLAPALGERIERDARAIVRALGYDMNSIEFAVRGGVPYAIDFMNPAPDMDIYSLTPHYFEWAVEKMTDMAIRLAKSPRGQAGALGWSALFTANRATAGAGRAG